MTCNVFGGTLNLALSVYFNSQAEHERRMVTDRQQIRGVSQDRIAHTQANVIVSAVNRQCLTQGRQVRLWVGKWRLGALALAALCLGLHVP